jgi:hypothetical protein
LVVVLRICRIRGISWWESVRKFTDQLVLNRFVSVLLFVSTALIGVWPVASRIDSKRIPSVTMLFVTWPCRSSVVTDWGTLSIQYVVQGACLSILQLLIALVIMLVCDSRAVSDSIELVQRANPVLTDRTSFKRCACSPRLLFRAVRTAKAPAVRALCSGPVLTNRRVSGRVGLVFVACSGGLPVGWRRDGPSAAAAWAYEVGGLGRAVEVGVERSVSTDSDTGGWGF